MSATTVKSPSYVRYIVLTALCVATTIAYIDRGCLGVAADDIRRDLDLNPKQLGWLLSSFFLTYAVFQIPTAALGHAKGSRWALTVYSGVWSVATGIGALATNLPVLLVSRLGMGMAEAGMIPCAASTIAQWFPSTRRAWASGMLGSFMGIGGALGSALTGLLL